MQRRDVLFTTLRAGEGSLSYLFFPMLFIPSVQILLAVPKVVKEPQF